MLGEVHLSVRQLFDPYDAILMFVEGLRSDTRFSTEGCHPLEKRVILSLYRCMLAQLRETAMRLLLRAGRLLLSISLSCCCRQL